MEDNKEKDIKKGKKEIPKNEDIYKDYNSCAIVLYGGVEYLEEIKLYIIENFVNTGLVKLIKPTYAKEEFSIVDETEYEAYIRFKKETEKKYMRLRKEIEKKDFDKSDKFNFAFILHGEEKKIKEIRNYIAEQHSVKEVTVKDDKERLYIVDKSQWEYFKRSTEHGEETMKAVALVASGRKEGNCYDFALFTLELLKEKGVDTELINFYEKKILPCCCSYECLQKYDPRKRKNVPCPINDDVPLIWEKVWAADILLIFVPTYGGLPPASWVAFTQRIQGLLKPEKTKTVVSAVVLASPHLSIGTEWTPAIIADEIKHINKEVAVFEVFNTAQYKTENLFGCLLTEEEVKRRLIFLVTRTLAILKDVRILRKQKR